MSYDGNISDTEMGRGFPLFVPVMTVMAIFFIVVEQDKEAARHDDREGGRKSATMAAPCAAPAPFGIPECTRPCYEGGGVVHDFCGRPHAAEAVSRGMRPRLRRPHGKCHVRTKITMFTFDPLLDSSRFVTIHRM